MKRIFKFSREINQRRNEKSICIAEVSSKLGASHIALSMANYISSVLREPVLYIEPTKYSNLLTVVGEKVATIENVSGYRFKGVDYCFTPDFEDITKLMLRFRGWIIIDLGVLEEQNERLFQKCDKKLIIGSMMPWCRRDYQEFIRNMLIDKYSLDEISFYEKNNSNVNKREFKEIYGCKLKTLPIIENPFSLKEKEFEVISMIIE